MQTEQRIDDEEEQRLWAQLQAEEAADNAGAGDTASEEISDGSGDDASEAASTAGEGDTSGAGEPTEEAAGTETARDSASETASTGEKPSDAELVKQYQTAMREEREKRQALEREFGEFKSALKELRAARQGSEEEQPQAPSIDEDPIGHFEYQNQQLQASIQETQKALQDRDKADQEARQHHDFMRSVKSSEDQFAEQNPDYWDAADHLRVHRLGQLEAIYPSTPAGDAFAQQRGFQSAEHMRLAHLENEVSHYSATAMQTGQSPAAVFYSLAKQAGYTGKKADAEPQKVDPQEVIKTTRAGVERSQSLSGGATGGKSDNASLGELTDLFITDPEAADALFDKLAASGQLG